MPTPPTSVGIYGNTVKDGTGDAHLVLLDTDGHVQVDILSSSSNQLPATLTGNGNLKVAVQETLPAGEAHVGQVGGNAKLIPLTLSIDTNIYADGDVLADTQELASALRVAAGSGYINQIRVNDKDDQGQPLDILILQTNVSIGTENLAVSISDANSDQIIARIQVYSSDYYDLGGVKIAYPAMNPILIEAAAASTSLWIAVVSRGTGTYSASGITLLFGIERN